MKKPTIINPLDMTFEEAVKRVVADRPDVKDIKKSRRRSRRMDTRKKERGNDEGIPK